MINRLEYTTAYLAGPMDRVKDFSTCIQWRKEITLFLQQELKVGVFDPCDKATIDFDEGPEVRELKSYLKKTGQFDKLHELMRGIVAVDLRMIDLAHFTILYIDTNVHMCGSYNEQTHSSLQRKPVIVCCEQGKTNVPDWLFGICNHNMFFESWDEVKTYLRHVAFDEKVETYNRWRFFNMRKVYHACFENL